MTRREFLGLMLWTLIPVVSMAQRLQQPMGRSVVVTYRKSTERSVTSSGGNGYLVSWRKLAQEPEGTTYNLYTRTAGATDFKKVNAQPLKVTNYKPSTVASNTEWAVTAVSPEGVEGPMSNPFLYKTQPWSNVWFKFDYDDKVITRNDYRTKYVWPMDLDGDGEIDGLVCDRLYAGASGEDDAENQGDNTATTSHKIQAYRLTGELLWTVDMGPNMNICAGHNDMVVACDINCDGRCEVIIKSSDGTRFWDKEKETWGLYAKGSAVADVDGDGIVDYRNQSVRNRPFYVSVIDGLTGAEIACSELKYDEVHDGSDTYTRNNRADYMSDSYSAMDGHFAIAYLDGVHPSLIMECYNRDNSKTHHYYVFTWDYDWTTGTPTNWHHSSTWSRNDKRPWPAEFHQLRVADVNGDGYEEMLQGGYSVNPLRNWFCSPGIGHGDRFVVSDIDPDRPGMETYAIQQSDLLGQLLYDSATGNRIKEWYLPSLYDVGRGTCMDVDPAHKGYEIYSHADDFIYDCKGDKTGYTRSGCGITQIFEGVWWDGDLLREELSSPGGSGWGTNLMVTKPLTKARLVEYSQESSWATHAATGTRPAFMGDVTGDWREEVILASQNADICTGIVGYTTNIPTDYSIYALQQDPHYRGDCTTRGYYQHPNTSFYLGCDMPLPPLPPVFTADLRYKGDNPKGSLSTFSNFNMTKSEAYADGKSLLFDIVGDNSKAITTDKPYNSPCIYIMNPRGHDYIFSSQSKSLTTGNGTLIKSMQGKARIWSDLEHTGATIISEGTLALEYCSIAGPVELRARGTLSGPCVLKDTITFEGALNYEGCRLMLGNLGMRSKKSMVLPGDVYLETTTAVLATTNDEFVGYECGSLYVEGDLTFQGKNYITVNLAVKDAATYVLAECTGKLTCDPSKLGTRGLDGVNYDLKVEDHRLLLIIHSSRMATDGVTWTGSTSNVWDYKAENFRLDENTAFVAGDAVLFDESGANRNIVLNEQMVTNGVTFNGGTYSFSGEGGISGSGDVIVNEGASVTFNLKNSDYTGKTIINQGGQLTVPNFYNGGQRSAIGASSTAAENLQLNGGTLVLSRDNMATDHRVTINDTATIRVAQANSALTLKGQVSGKGYLVKDGPGQLNFSYGGANTFAGIIVKKGVVAQGTWNTTFGRSGGNMVLAGGEVHLIDNNNSSTMPVLNHVVTVEEGTTNRILGTSRGKINGSFKGTGNLTIETRYVRCDVGANFAAFQGTLTAAGSQFRLMTNVTDMSKTKLVLAAGAYVAHFQSGSGNAGTATTKIGSLSAPSTAADAVLGGSGSTYQIGFLNEDTQFYGLFQAASIIKVGTGKLTLRSVGHTSPITVNGGTLELFNTSNTAMTSETITVGNGGMLSGNGLAGTVNVNKGGVLAAGISSVAAGTLRMASLNLRQGATVRCQLFRSGNSKFKVSGRITHAGDTLLVVIPDTRTLEVGDEIEVFPQGFTSATGDVIVKCQVEEGQDSYEFDTSTLNTDGKLRVSAVTTGIASIMLQNRSQDIYTTDGRLLRRADEDREVQYSLPAGVYIIGGKKVMMK